MSDKGRDCATQLVCVEISVDSTKHTLLSSAHEHEQRDSANETIVIVTHKLVSAVNCPIKVVIVPLSWLEPRRLSISQSAHTVVIAHKHEQRDSANETSVIVTDKYCSEVNCPTKVGMVPLS